MRPSPDRQRERLESERAAIADRIAATQSLLESTGRSATATQEWAVLGNSSTYANGFWPTFGPARAAERVLSQRQEGVREADVDRLKAEYAEMIRLAAAGAAINGGGDGRRRGHDPGVPAVADGRGVCAEPEGAGGAHPRHRRIPPSGNGVPDRERQNLVAVERDLSPSAMKPAGPREIWTRSSPTSNRGSESSGTSSPSKGQTR